MIDPTEEMRDIESDHENNGQYTAFHGYCKNNSWWVTLDGSYQKDDLIRILKAIENTSRERSG